MTTAHKILCLLNAFRICPIWFFAKNNKNWKVLNEDINRWKEWKSLSQKYDFIVFLYLMSLFKEFRNIVYKRMGKIQYLVRWLCPPLDTLYIHCNNIGGGLIIQHGFATIITAKSIGKNAKIFQQVTIGYNADELPVIGDNVEICCGAKVIGGVHVGNNVVIGANAVVVTDIPDNAVAVGVPAKVKKEKISTNT